MFYRATPVMLSASLLGLVTSLAMPGSVRAHRLVVECHTLSGGKVQVESWFDLTGSVPRGAQVQVLRMNGEPLLEGRLDDRGIFVFSVARAEPLKVVVWAGDGHRGEETIPAQRLADALGIDAGHAPAARDQQPAPVPAPLSDRSPRVSLKDGLTGVGFLLALAAFVMSLRNARLVRDLQARKNRP